MGLQEQFFRQVAARKSIRITVRSICVQDGYLLVVQPSDNPDACYSFIGGEIEFSELMEEGLKREYQEEMGVEAKVLRYLFMVENLFQFDGKLIHSLEHYFQTEVSRPKTISQESHLIQCWLPVKHLPDYDIRPCVVRDAVFDGSWSTAKRFIVPFI
jgi:ADP-ribose pyrophosphatase YjhB (NUDIX family)